MSSTDLLKHIRVLSSDDYEGRAPGTRGEELTLRYLEDQFSRMGLEPGNPDGTYRQRVPLVGFESDVRGSFTVAGKENRIRFPEDCVAVSRRSQEEVRVSGSDLEFVGYGIVAPEYGWDDYKGIDVHGKTLVMLINDPPVPDPQDPSELDESMFKGKSMTYYGRWTYKYEIASRKGAVAAILIHETGPAGYPYQVLVGDWGREKFGLFETKGSPVPLAAECWMSSNAAKKLFSEAGWNFESLKKSAARRGFAPVALGARLTLDIKNKRRIIQSGNFVARLEGSDRELSHQYVIYSAHWDHLGRNEDLKGDKVYNGALDNASGTACLIELARAFKQLRTPPRRTLLFLSLTAEEEGLLGAKYYVENPLYPLEHTAADINIDGINVWGRTRDLVVIGLGNSTLDDILRTAARSQDRILRPDTEPGKGLLYRSDQFEFASHGVPTLFTDTGIEFVGGGAELARERRDQYTTGDYHRVTDEVKPEWDLSGAMEDLELFFRTGYRVAQDDGMPKWKPAAGFNAARSNQSRGHRQQLR
jgi:Zn-dependent M28 family amino/carboxypeptidase